MAVRGAYYPTLERKFYFSDQDHGVIETNVDTNGSPSVTWYQTQGVLETSDGGATWNYRDLPNPPESTASDGIVLSLFTKIDSSHWIACGQNGGTSSYGLPGYAVIWETANSGLDWEIKKYWQEDYSTCTGLGANADGKALAFFTPYAWGGLKYLLVRDESGNWSIKQGNNLITNSGYGPADVPMVGNTAWVTNDSHSSLPAGLYRSEDAGSNWTRISTALLQYMDFASDDKGFALAGGPVYVTYDGGANWLYQSAGAGYCCHGNDIWAFDTTHAVWHEAGVGDPNDVAQIFNYVEPWEANFEILPAIEIKDGYVAGGDVNVPMASYELFNHGPVPIRAKGLILKASGTGNDQTNITQAKLWLDQNANGFVDQGDDLLGQGTYSSDNGTVALSLGDDFVLKQFVPAYLLVTYDFTLDLPLRKVFTFDLSVDEVNAETTDLKTAVWPTAPPDHLLAGRTVMSAQEIFFDGFEGGMGTWNISTDDPIPDPGYGWQQTDTYSVSPAHSAFVFDDSKHEGWATNDYMKLTQPVSLSPMGDYYLTFYHRYELQPGVKLWVEVSNDGGTNWVPIGKYGSHETWGSYSTNDFVYEALDLSTYALQSILIRFRYDNTSGATSSGKWYVDDVKVFHNPILCTGAVCNPPKNLHFTGSLSKTIMLGWDANTDADLGGYKLYYGKAPGSYDHRIDIGSATEWTVKGLALGQPYYFTIAAYDLSGAESAKSSEVSGKLLTYTVKSNPSGRQVVVDGVTYVNSKLFYWITSDSSPMVHTLSVPSPQTLTTGTTRYLYSSWSDGGDQMHTITPLDPSDPSYTNTYTVYFATQYSLTTSVSLPEAASINVSPDPLEEQWYEKNEAVSISVAVNPGYTFQSWSGAGRTNPASIVMSGPKVIKAVVRQAKYTMKLTAAPLRSGSITRSPNKSSYVYGEEIVLTAAPKPGYVFSGWTIDGVNYPDNPITVMMDGNKSFQANFSLSPPQ